MAVGTAVTVSLVLGYLGPERLGLSRWIPPGRTWDTQHARLLPVEARSVRLGASLVPRRVFVSLLTRPPILAA
ncbi:MAG: hypothetical protein WKF75_10755 [Singulisphaera sp.]